MSHLAEDYFRLLNGYSRDTSLPVFDQESDLVKSHKKSRRIEEEFPEIVPEIERILLLNGYAAHKDRHIDHDQFFGTSMNVLVEHLLTTFPLLAKSHPHLAPTTLAHLFISPNEASPSAHKYKSILHARPYQPRNDDFVSSLKIHFCHAQVRIMCELFSYFSASIYSCDNKHKVSIGVSAVNRLNRARKWFMKDDLPKFPIHDYPKPFHIIPSGYLSLKWSEPHQYRCEEFDQLSRAHVSFPRTGQLYIFNRADYFFKATMTSHLRDLKQVIQMDHGKKDCLMVVDHGPDYSWKGNVTNLLQYYTLWREMKLQNLGICGYAPEDSAFNFIERSWSEETIDITGYTIPNTLNDRVVDKNSSEKDIAALNDESVKVLSSFWHGKMHNGFAVQAFSIDSSLSMEQPEFDAEGWHDYLMKHKIHDDPEKNDTIRCAADHCVKTEDLLWFAPCYFFDRPACSHCSSLGPHSEMLVFLKEKMNSVLPFPEASSQPSHYKTFLDLINSPENRSFGNLGTLRSCDEHVYHFDSEADMRRHFDICHNGQPTKSYAKNYFKCTHVKDKMHCTVSCDSLLELEDHVASEHSNKRHRKDSKNAILANGVKKTRCDYYSITSDGTNCLLEGKVIEKGSLVDAWFDDAKSFYCGVVEGFTPAGRAKLYFEVDDTRNSLSTRLRLCRCAEEK